MLTVKKFGAMLDLAYGGYAGGVIGLIFALLAITVFPPDLDLQDDDESSSESNILTATLASVVESATDNDIDDPIPEHEKKDEINDTVLGVNICLIFFGWLLVIASLLLIYGTFKRQSRLLLPFIFALFETVLLVILLEVLPEFIDNLGVGWFLLLNIIIAVTAYFLIVVYSLYRELKEEELNRLNF